MHAWIRIRRKGVITHVAHDYEYIPSQLYAYQMQRCLPIEHDRIHVNAAINVHAYSNKVTALHGSVKSE